MQGPVVNCTNFRTKYFAKGCGCKRETKPFINMNLANVTNKSYENP